MVSFTAKLCVAGLAFGGVAAVDDYNYKREFNRRTMYPNAIAGGEVEVNKKVGAKKQGAHQGAAPEDPSLSLPRLGKQIGGAVKDNIVQLLKTPSIIVGTVNPLQLVFPALQWQEDRLSAKYVSHGENGHRRSGSLSHLMYQWTHGRSPRNEDLSWYSFYDNRAVNWGPGLSFCHDEGLRGGIGRTRKHADAWQHDFDERNMLTKLWDPNHSQRLNHHNDDLVNRGHSYPSYKTSSDAVNSERVMYPTLPERCVARADMVSLWFISSMQITAATTFRLLFPGFSTRNSAQMMPFAGTQGSALIQNALALVVFYEFMTDQTDLVHFAAMVLHGVGYGGIYQQAVQPVRRKFANMNVVFRLINVITQILSLFVLLSVFAPFALQSGLDKVVDSFAPTGNPALLAPHYVKQFAKGSSGGSIGQQVVSTGNMAADGIVTVMTTAWASSFGGAAAIASTIGFDLAKVFSHLVAHPGNWAENVWDVAKAERPIALKSVSTMWEKTALNTNLKNIDDVKLLPTKIYMQLQQLEYGELLNSPTDDSRGEHPVAQQFKVAMASVNPANFFTLQQNTEQLLMSGVLKGVVDDYLLEHVRDLYKQAGRRGGINYALEHKFWQLKNWGKTLVTAQITAMSTNPKKEFTDMATKFGVQVKRLGITYQFDASKLSSLFKQMGEDGDMADEQFTKSWGMLRKKVVDAKADAPGASSSSSSSSYANAAKEGLMGSYSKVVMDKASDAVGVVTGAVDVVGDKAEAIVPGGKTAVKGVTIGGAIGGAAMTVVKGGAKVIGLKALIWGGKDGK